MTEQTINVLEYQYASSPDGPWGESCNQEVVDMPATDWEPHGRTPFGNYRRYRVVAYAPVQESEGDDAGAAGVGDDESECAPTLVALAHDDAVTRLSAAMREADREFESVGGGTRHHVRDCLLPALMRAGIWVGEAIVDPCHDCMLSAPDMCGGAYCNRAAEVDRNGRADE